jgi:hypothetical protein
MHGKSTNPITDADNECVLYSTVTNVQGQDITVDKTQAKCHALQHANRQMLKRPLNQ